MQFKRCFKCQCELPLSAFYKHAQMGDGHLNKCKECAKKDAKAVRLARIDYYREYDRARASMPHRMQKNIEIGRRWRAAHPLRKQAQTAVSNAIRAGRLQPEPCLVCGAKAEAHHPDYSQPLDVVWLCPPHHKQTHAMTR